MLDSGLTPLDGGHSGETFLGTSGAEQVVVRIHGGRSAQRGPDAVDIDAAVLRLVRGLLPVPRVLEVRRPDPTADVPAILVTSFLPGTRLDLVLPGADDDLQRRIGASLGGVLTRLNRMPFLTTGPFIDADLSIGSFGPEASDLRTFAESLVPGSALERWPTDDLERLLTSADRAQDLLDPIDRHCLVHSDFNPKNLLVDPATGEVTGVLDWEFAHAGLPVTDLGNLLRHADSPVFVDAVIEATEIDAVPGDLIELAVAADLWALVELASRAGENPAADRANDLLLARLHDHPR
ncbi:phosphotransferase family protein [Nocardioides jensenii]|uniref:phosphotransferase family protein n=1 Tax=Nocardioides jensenii TaxID=1843 RepID=UPI00082EFBCD|nr:phosphotransferase [Nocardioides jensenii]